MAKPSTKTTTYASKGKKTAPKELSPTHSDDDESPDTSLEGKLLDEEEEPNAPPKTRGKAKPQAPPAAAKAKPPAKSAPDPKKVVPSLPSSEKVVSKTRPSTQSKVKDAPESKAKGHESESEFDTGDEEEKVISKSKEKVKEDKKEVQRVRPTRGKADSSKLPTSNDSSTKSSTNSKPSTKKEEVFAAPSLPSPTPADPEDEDEFGPDLDFNSSMVDEIENDLQVKGLSPSSPINLKKGTQVSPPPVAKSLVNKETTVEPEEVPESIRPESKSRSKSISKSKSNSPELSELDEEEDEVPDTSETKVGVDDAEGKENADDDDNEGQGEGEDKDESMSGEEEVDPIITSATSQSRSQKSALKRLAEYDSNAVTDSVGLLLEDMSVAKKPRLSAASPTKSAKIDNKKPINKVNNTSPARAPVKATPKTSRGKKNTAPAEALPPIDYVGMVREKGYGREVIQRLIAKKSEQERKCDWYELSVELAEEGVRRLVIGKGKKSKKGQEVISGNDLHDLFHNVSPSSASALLVKPLADDQIVLPGLKAGKPLWVDSDDSASPESAMVQTPEGDDDEMDDGPEYESEEEAFEPKSTRARGMAKRG